MLPATSTAPGLTAAVKAFVVTGAGGGLGREVVAALVRRGSGVFAVDIDDEAAGRAAADAGGGAIPHAADMTDAAAVEAAIASAVGRFGRLDGIFNNAAVLGPSSPIAEYSEDEFQRVLRTNVVGVFLGMKFAVPALRASDGGVILNTASTGGLMGWPNLAGYVASKHAVVGLTRTVALELAGTGIRVNALCPGPMDTSMIWEVAEGMAPGDRAEQERELAATVPVGRLGRPEEVAAMAAWLLDECPGYLTGAVIPIDGAQTAG